MTTRKEWRDAIQRNDQKTLGKIRGRLFANFDEAVAFLRGLSDVLKPEAEQPDHVVALCDEASSAFLELDLAHSAKLIDLSDPNLTKKDAIDFFAYMYAPGAIKKHGYLALYMKLLDVYDFQTACTGSRSPTVASAIVALLVLPTEYLNYNTPSWTLTLEAIRASRDVTPLLRLFEAVHDASWRIQLKNISDFEEMRIFGKNYIDLPVPAHLRRWMLDVYRIFISKMNERNAKLSVLTKRMRNHADWYRDRYDEMWLDMMVEPKWGLRTGNLDCVEMDIDGLRAMGIRRISFEAINEFPEFRATFDISRVYNGSAVYTMEFSPTGLYSKTGLHSSEDEIDASDEVSVEEMWQGRVVAFVTVSAVWEIVMGRRSRQSVYPKDSEANGSASAIVRPRFRRLPEGHQSSEKARERALAVMNAKPLPGFTFVREYIRGAFPQSGAPLFTLTEMEKEQL